MTDDQIKSQIFSNVLQQAQKNDFIIDPQNYAKKKTELIMEFEGRNMCQKFREYFQDVDISKYLAEIRNQEKEHVLILAISDGSVKASMVLQGDNDCIHAKSYFEKKKNSFSAIEFISNHYNAGDKICNYHNHPLRIAAIPSNQDINSLCSTNRNQECTENEWTSCVEQYGIDLPAEFYYDDWGVVTACDFFSSKQFIESGHELSEIISQNEENDNKAKGILSEYTV